MLGTVRCSLKSTAGVGSILRVAVLNKCTPVLCAPYAHRFTSLTPEMNATKVSIGVPQISAHTLNYSTAEAESVQKRIDRLVKENKIVVFMKGTPEAPRCGFSNAVMQILRMHGVKDFNSHNVLEDDDIRQGIKEYSQWPTIPQVFIDGEFVGGCDIMIEMHQKGELIEELKKIGIRSALLDKPASTDSQ